MQDMSQAICSAFHQLPSRAASTVSSTTRRAAVPLMTAPNGIRGHLIVFRVARQCVGLPLSCPD